MSQVAPSAVTVDFRYDASGSATFQDAGDTATIAVTLATTMGSGNVQQSKGTSPEQVPFIPKLLLIIW